MPSTINLTEALRRTAEGLPLIITDDTNRENEGDLFVAAAHITTQLANLFITHGRGLLFATLTPQRALELDLPLMVPRNRNTEAHGCQFAVSVDAVAGTTTGIAAAERAHTLRVLAHPATKPADLRRPGHVFPLVAAAGGLQERQGQTEACVTLCALAGLPPVGVGCEVLDAAGGSARGAALQEIATRLNIPIFTIADLMSQVQHLPTWPAPTAAFVASARLPTTHATFTIHIFRANDGKEHTVLTLGDVTSDAPVLTRLHSQCLTGDTFHSLKCDCHGQLNAALSAIAQTGRGILLYLQQEGRGIGLGNKIRAYALQDQGLDTVEANLALGFDADLRDYRVAADILHALGVRQISLLTNNPGKIEQLTTFGIAISRRVPLVSSANGINGDYLRVKAAKLGHQLTSPP